MRSQIASLLAAVPIVLAVPAPAPAWDYPGHRIVGMIADIVMQRDHPAAYAKVMALLAKHEPEDKAKDKENRTKQFTGLLATMKAAAEAK